VSIRKITKAKVVRYLDNLSTRGEIDYVDEHGKGVHYSGDPRDLYTMELLRRAVREGVRVDFVAEGWIPNTKELERREKAGRVILSKIRSSLTKSAAHNSAGAGREHLLHTFAKLPVGATFWFESEKTLGPSSSVAKGPWVKVSARKYRHVEDPTGRWIYTVGRSSSRVLHQSPYARTA
jgi:hypothetical protein